MTQFKLDEQSVELEQKKKKAHQLQIQIQQSLNLPFQQRLQSSKWQIRKKLYEDMIQILCNNQSLLKIGLQSENEQIISNYVIRLLNEPHLSTLNDSLKVIELYTQKAKLSNNHINQFISYLIEKAGANMINLKILQKILQNCMDTSEKALFVLNQLIRYASHPISAKNTKIILFCLSGIRYLLLKYQLKNQKSIVDLFNLHRTLLELTSNKQIRTIALQNTAQILYYIKQPFEELAENQLKQIRPIVLKQLSNLIKQRNSKSSNMNPNTSNTNKIITQNEKEVKHIDILTLLPLKFLEIKVINQNNQKTKVLNQLENKLEKLQPSMIQKKDYTLLYTLLEIPLEQYNFLISSSALKILKYLLRLCYKNIPTMNVKRFLSLTVEKYKGAKSKNFNIQIHEMVTLLMKNKSMSDQSLIQFMFEIIANNKNLNAKIGLLDWFSTEFQKICLQFLQQGDTSVFQNITKMRKIVTIVRKKNQNLHSMTQKNNISKIKQEIQLLTLVLNNLETSQNNSINQQRLMKTQLVDKTEQTKPKKSKMNSTVSNYHFKQKQKQKEKQKSSQQNQEQYEYSKEQTKQNITQEVSHKSKIIDKLQKSLNNLKKIAISNNENILNKQMEECWKIIDNQSEQICQNFQQVLNILITLVDEINCLDLKKTSISLKLYIKEKLFEFVLKVITKINKSVVNIDQNTLILELYLIFNKIDNKNMKKIQSLLDSLYMSCPLESFLKVTYQILKSNNQCNPVVRNIYSTWLSYKIDHSQNFNVNTEFLNYIYNLIINLDQKIANSIKNKIQKFTGKIEPLNKVHFMTPQKTSNKKKIEEKNSKSYQKITTFPTLTEENNKLPQEIALLIKIIQEDTLTGIFQCKTFITQILNDKGMKNDNKNLKKSKWQQYSQLQIFELQKALCQKANSQNWSQISFLIIQFKQLFPSFLGSILRIFFNEVCKKEIYVSTIQKRKFENLLKLLLENVPLKTIIEEYRNAFSMIYYSNQDIYHFIVNLLEFIVETYLNNQISIKECQYFAQSLIASLQDKRLKKMSEEYLDKIHKFQTQDNFLIIKKTIMNKLKGNSSLLLKYNQWIENEYQKNQDSINEDFEIRTIQELTQIQPGQASTSKTLEGYEHFINTKNKQEYNINNDCSIQLNKITKSDRGQSQKKQKKVNFKLEEIQKFNLKTDRIKITDKKRNSDIIQQSVEDSIINQTNQISQIKIRQELDYKAKQKKIQTLLIPEKPTQLRDCIKQLQQLFLTSEHNPQELIQNLWQTFNNLNDENRKLQFIFDLKSCVLNKNFLMSLSEINYQTLLNLILKICANYPKQLYDSIGSKTLQQLLNILLTFQNPNVTLVTCIRILNQELSSDFKIELTFQCKLMFRLLTNCLDKLVEMSITQIRTFQVLLEIYKFFRIHPPQMLVEGLPSVKDIQNIFKVLKKVTDKVVENDKMKSQEFYTFICRKNNQNVYLEYLRQSINQIN